MTRGIRYPMERGNSFSWPTYAGEYGNHTAIRVSEGNSVVKLRDDI